MSIIRLYRDTQADDGRRLFEYREAWLEPDGATFTVHHGRVGQPGTAADQPVAGPEEGEELLAAFLAQGLADGFAEADPDGFATVLVEYRLRGREASSIERRHAETLREEITHQLAWRGLGEVVEVTEQDGALVLTVATPHPAKAATEVETAARRAPGIQPNKVSVRRAAEPADTVAQVPGPTSDPETTEA